MVPSKNKILKDLDELVATNQGVFERCKAIADDPACSPTDRREAVYVANEALQQSRSYALLAEQLRAGVIDRKHAAFVAMYRR